MSRCDCRIASLAWRPDCPTLSDKSKEESEMEMSAVLGARRPSYSAAVRGGGGGVAAPGGGSLGGPCKVPLGCSGPWTVQEAFVQIQAVALGQLCDVVSGGTPHS